MWRCKRCTDSHTVSSYVPLKGCPRDHRRRAAGWSGWTEQLAQDLQGAHVSQLACVIRTDTVAITSVIGSHQFDRVLHDVITFSILGQCLHESSTL